MLKIKFLVSVIYFSNIFVCATKYCEICPEHTLCKYKVPGPSPQCVGYDPNALLSEDDRNSILDKINERRNFIAIGHSRFFPTAANMNKLMWSEELATFAQRWVDQCDQYLRPDRKDKCRDLDFAEVGQCIATVTGSSSRYNVKSLVEMWFMESMDYTGSVTYYNQSRDHKTNYFTQLIWADTDKVGCGKAKFFVKNVKPVIVDRLVCNFAPRGNIHGKPIYTIGYAATQCGSGMERDTTFPGLCSRRLKPKGTLPPLNPSATSTSFLRIRNLFNNDSARQEIDPIYSNINQTKKDLQITTENHSYVLHFVNNSYDAVKRSYPFKNEEIWNNHRLNNSTYYYGDYFQKRDKGHSRVYHGHDHRNEFDYLHPETVNQNARRYDYPTTSNMEQDYRKHNIDQHCTRKSERKLTVFETSGFLPCKQKINKCTRGQKSNNCRQNNDCQMTTHRCEKQVQTTTHPNSREFCECTPLSTAYHPNSNQCAHTTSFECVNVNCATKPCAHMLRTLRDEELEKPIDFQYYDALSYIAQHSTSRSILRDSHITRDILSDENPFSPISKHMKRLNRRKQRNRNHSERKRRAAEEQENFKPFWQMDEYVNQNQPQLKSMRYTTLSNKKNAKNIRTRKRPKTTMKTEPITVTHKERINNGKRITEKYLSFDELMHLRKNTPEDLGGRRYYDEKEVLRASNTSTTVSETTTTESTSTTEETPQYSFNTPYIRMKYCTRKLTCTWTAASLTDSAGSIIPGGGGNAIGGSRTPPGYVEGCTRTSTCTRDYMHRNKMATLPIETTSPEPEPGDDEDYCERRSLNRRSNSNTKQGNQTNYFFNNVSNLNKSLFEAFNNCICYDRNFRSKRQDYIHNDSISRYTNLVKRESKNHIKYETGLLSYSDLYYYVVRKIIEMWQIAKSSYFHEKCLCNGVRKILRSNLFLIFSMVLILYFPRFL
ncbi:uncharacterized protein LOC123867827 isoform X2 [Maniola jurtina]|uniref:uncharacterized protein LOC123867827 isoform X2 n=1 Tax=Maniola jurtina TaxID=191418 RepID=UPI001E687EA4|nr:uncharacterized protein LOC123867827 isoform X2 [Maniola jurtina]